MQFRYVVKVLQIHRSSVFRDLFEHKQKLKELKEDDSYYTFYQRLVAEGENKLREIDTVCKILNEATVCDGSTSEEERLRELFKVLR